MKTLITGGAGYIGSLLAGSLVRDNHEVVVLDKLLFGGESILPYLGDPNFRFKKSDVTEDPLEPCIEGVDSVVHLAAIVGFPACQQVGPDVARLYNVKAVDRVFDAAERAGCKRFIFASTYSNYGLSGEGGAVTEESPLNPQSLYAETKVEAEKILLEKAKHSTVAPLVFRFATLYGISPRTRFDLIVNQFVLEALTKRELIIYQRGYSRSFVHIEDAVRAIRIGLDKPAEEIRGLVLNVGGDEGNFTKDEIVEVIREEVRGVEVKYKDMTFGGDMRDIRVSFEKIRNLWGFKPKITLRQGIREIRDAVESGLITDPGSPKYRNAHFVVQ